MNNHVDLVLILLITIGGIIQASLAVVFMRWLMAVIREGRKK